MPSPRALTGSREPTGVDPEQSSLSPAEAYKAARGLLHCCPPVTMKAALLALLVTGLALKPGSALQCYTCRDQVSNENCLKVQNCTESETQCWTKRIRAIGLLTVISKGCSSHCEDDSQDYYVGKKNITCCDTNLCNASGAWALKPAAATLAPLTILSLLLWGLSQL
ncbi:prostate stem cell antigen [Callithrix jacchus]